MIYCCVCEYMTKGTRKLWPWILFVSRGSELRIPEKVEQLCALSDSCWWMHQYSYIWECLHHSTFRCDCMSWMRSFDWLLHWGSVRALAWPLAVQSQFLTIFSHSVEYGGTQGESHWPWPSSVLSCSLG